MNAIGRWTMISATVGGGLFLALECVPVHSERRALGESSQSDRGDDRNRGHGRGIGWPFDRRDRRSATRPLTASPSESEARLRALNQRVVACARCPRLVEWRATVAREKRAAYAAERY